MLYDLFFALFEAFKWIIIGTCLMAVLGLVFVGIPAALGQRDHVRYVRRRQQALYEKELAAQHATFYGKDDTFFESMLLHVHGEELEKPFQDQEDRVFDTSIDAVLRDEAMRFLSGEHAILDEPPTLFEKTVGYEVLGGEYHGQDQPRLLRDMTTTFLKNTDGNTDGFRKLL